jgi:hypothetical protein
MSFADLVVRVRNVRVSLPDGEHEFLAILNTGVK